MWIRRLVVALAIIAIGLALAQLLTGCGPSSNGLYQMSSEIPNRGGYYGREGVTDTYELEVLEPPASSDVAKVSVEMYYHSGEHHYGEKLLEPLSEENPNTVSGQAPENSTVRFTVWFNFKSGYCHSPQEEFYCGPVRLRSNNLYYACSETGENGCELREIKTVLKAAMQNAGDEPGIIEYRCDDDDPDSDPWQLRVEPWTPRLCVYEPFDPLTF